MLIVPDALQFIVSGTIKEPAKEKADKMRAFLGIHIIGVFAFDKNNDIIAYRLFSKKPETIAEKLKAVKNNEVLPEEKEIIEELRKKGYKEIVTDRCGDFGDIICIQKKEHQGIETLNSSFRKIAIDLRWASSQAEINEILSKVHAELTKSKLREKKNDKIIIQAVNTLDEIDKVINVFVEHLREWYGLYFPEAVKRISSPEKLIEIVCSGDKKEVEDKELRKLAEKTAGMDFSDEDLEEVKKFAKIVSETIALKKSLNKYIEESTKTTAPNLSAVAGPLMAARLLSLAGGLEKISRLPSSTIQLLGAEKALFRHLRGEGKAPKYGILFGHPYIQKAGKKNKGKIARLIASKLSIAARMDMFSGKDEGEKLKKELEEQVNKILKH
ncbi:MAG: hypothetical protein DRP16_05435 [Candidatus Aenigmatarchaeota archaeon]|nr:MAG: hypothetical protein DRP16_05435 [Candidatus Aenigmarchaeota archaeon]